LLSGTVNPFKFFAMTAGKPLLGEDTTPGEHTAEYAHVDDLDPNWTALPNGLDFYCTGTFFLISLNLDLL
jgi:hypothetical protein